MKRDNKQRLFEVMQRVAPNFTGKAFNEDFEQEETSEFLPITAPVGSPDDKLFTDIVNQGIDSSLEGFTKSKFEIKNASTGNRKVFNFDKSEIPILVRRLQELGTPEAEQWADDIQNYDKNIQEITENL